MDFESIKRLGLNHYNFNLTKSFEIYDSSSNNHTIILHLNKDSNLCCPVCGSINVICKGSKFNTLKYSSGLENNIIIKLYRRCYYCKDCSHYFKENNPLTCSKKTITLQKDIQIINALKDKNNTYTSVAKKFNVSPTYVIDTFDRKVDLKRLSLPQVLCIDEVYAKKLTKHSYCCILYSPQRNKIIDILDSRHKFNLIEYFSRIPKIEKNNVKFISIDMWESYRQVAHLCFPKAILCVDSFHVIYHLNLAFQKIRIKIMKKYENLKYEKTYKYKYWLYKKYWKFLLTDISNLPDNHIKINKSKMYLTKYQIIEYMLELDNDLKNAYELKEEYRNFNSLATIDNAEAWLSDIIVKFENSNIVEFQPFINTIRNWKTEIINSFNRINGFRISNAKLERINNDIKQIFSTSFGSTNFIRIRNRIMFCINDMSPILYSRKNRSNKKVGKSRGKYNKNK